MATGNIRDVRLGVEVTTAGEDDLRRLAGAVRSLGQEGDPAAAEFARLANELDRLADQAGAVQSLRSLRGDVERLTVAEREASAAAAATSARYQEQTAATAALREAQAQAAAAAAASKSQYAELTAELQRQIAAGRAAGQSQRELATATEQARVAVINQKLDLTQRNQALREADLALRAATRSEQALATQSERSSTAAASTLATLRQQAAALQTTEAAAESLGLGLADLDAAESRFRASLEATVAALTEQRAVQAAVSELDDQAAASAQRLADRTRAVAAAYEQEQAAATAAAAATARVTAEQERAEAASRALAEAEARRVVAAREQYEADRLAIIQANGLAEARARGRAAAESELATIRESEQFMRRFAAAQAEAAAAIEREGVEAMRALERAAQEADAQMAALATSLRATETAARQFTAATEAAAAAGNDDTAATQARVRAAEALIASERGLTTAQRELAVERDRSRASLLGEAQALLQTQRAAAEAQRAIATLAVEARQAGQTLERAFGSVGIRSIDAIEREIEETSAALVRLTSAARAGALSQDELGRAAGAAEVKIARLRAEIQQVQTLPSVFDRLNNGVTGLLTRFGALSAAIATMGVAVRPVIEATVALEQMRRVLTTVTGSAETAQRQIDFLRQVSQQSGQAFDQLGQSYAKFAASALQSGLTIQQTQEVFRSVALAAGNLGLSSDQAKRALEALSQIASKGTVSMEELRQQLGDALPGVLPLLAKELGLTQAELNKVVESGQLLASEAIPAIGRSLQALQGQGARVEGLVASWNRFVNVIKQAGVEIVEGPLGSAAGAVLSSFAGVIRDVSVVVLGFNEALKLTGLTALSVIDLLKGDLTFKQFGDQISDFAEQSGDRLQKFKDTAYGTSEGTQALARDLSGLGTSFARLALDQQKAIDQATTGAQVAEKRAAALKLESEQVAQFSELAGDEARARDEAAAASQRATEASEQQLAADRRVVESLQQAKTAIEARAQAEGLSRDQIKATVEKLDEKIAKAQADVEKTEAQTRALQSQTAALQLAADATGDQSKRIEELKRNVEQAEAAYRNLVIAAGEDATVSAEAEKAALALAKAKGLLRNAIDDVAEALDRQLALLRADQKLAEASIKLDIERAKVSRDAALAVGNEYAARQQALKIKELELALDRSGQRAKTEEAEATLRALDLMERELRASGQLTAEKSNEIEVRRTLARASVLETAATEQANVGKEREIELLRRGGSAREEYNTQVDRGRSLLDGDTQATNSNTSARESNLRMTELQSIAMGKWIDWVKAATRAQEQFNSTAGPSNLSSGLDARNASVRSSAGDNLDANGFVTDAGGGTLSQLGSKNLMDYTRDLATGALVLRAVSTPTGGGGGRNEATSTRTSAPTPVNIVINGRRATINTATAADANALAELLRQLQNDFARANG